MNFNLSILLRAVGRLTLESTEKQEILEGQLIVLFSRGNGTRIILKRRLGGMNITLALMVI